MFRRILTSSKGLTLVELLAALAVFSIISVIIIGYLIGGMKSFTKVNEDIALHDEANYVMSQFVNYIFVAIEVNKYTDGDCENCIAVKKYGEDTTIKLGFHDGDVKIDGKAIQNSKFKFLDESMFIVNEDTVYIKMVIQGENNKILKLDSKVSFVKVDP